ncbi:MAG TPA: cytochrome c oxidase subunit 3 [Candidatus Limnocylindria bacterium]|nr:cytochrome c oxidase subunit 3 [Candidatus Limnocylindria bacterium]
MTAGTTEMQAGESHLIETHQTGMPTVMVGMLLFIASEVMFFGGLFATYFNARAGVAPEPWEPPPGGELDMALAAVLTAILVSSSFTMQFGVWAIRRGDTGKMKMWTGITLALGVLFLAGQLYDYSQLGFGIADGVFGTVFYTLTGFHGAHVFGGAVGLTIILARAIQGQFSARNHIAVEAVSIYWHFVDVVWIAVFSTIYLLR